MKRVWIVFFVAAIFKMSLASFSQSEAANYACIANRNSDQVASISILDRTVINDTNLPLELKGSTFFGVAIMPNGYAYVANPSSNKVYVLDTLGDEDLDPIEVGGKPVGVAASPNGRFVYVTSRANKKVWEIDTESDPLEATELAKVWNAPIGIDVSPDGRHVFVVSRDGFSENSKKGSFHAIRASNGVIEWTVDKLGKEPVGVVVSPGGERVYVTNRGSNNLSVINTEDEDEEAESNSERIKVGKTPIGVAVSPDGEYVFVANSGDDTVSVIQTDEDVLDFEVIHIVKVGAYPVGVSVTPDGAQLYVTCRGETSEDGIAGVYVIDTYDFTVIDEFTEDGQNEGLFLSPASFGQFITPLSKPEAPTGFEATAVSDTQINLTWDDKPFVVSEFRIERRLGSHSAYGFETITVDADETTYSDSVLDEATTYCYRIKAVNAKGSSKYAEAEATTYPTPPSNLTATAVSSSEIELTWTYSSDKHEGFIVQGKLASSDAFKTMIGKEGNVVLAANVTTCSVTLLDEYTSYSFRVLAVDEDGLAAAEDDLTAFDSVERTSYSEETSATTELGTPTNLSATNYYTKHVDLSWTDNSSETGFTIQRKKVSGEDSDGSSSDSSTTTASSGATTTTDSSDDTTTTASGDGYTDIGTVGQNVTGYRDDDVDPRTTYSYRVQATNGNDVSGYSNETQADTSDRCFIATAAYGSLLEPHVVTLRRFRDIHLLPCSLGRMFVKTYYTYSPPIADFIAQHDTLRALVRIGLLPLVAFSYSALHFGPIATTMFLVLLMTASMYCFLYFRWRRNHQGRCLLAEKKG